MTTITEVSHLTAGIRRQFRWAPDVFEASRLGVLLPRLAWRPMTTGYLLSVDGEPVSYYGLLRHRCVVNDLSVEIGGMGGLVTVPARQRQGYGARLVAHVLDVLRHAWRVDAGLCFCLDHRLAFHVRMGGQQIDLPVRIDSPSGSIASPFHALLWPFRTDLWPVRTIDLQSLPW